MLFSGVQQSDSVIHMCVGGGGASLVAQIVKNLSAMQEMQVPSLGGEYPPEKGMATHSSMLG